MVFVFSYSAWFREEAVILDVFILAAGFNLLFRPWVWLIYLSAKINYNLISK